MKETLAIAFQELFTVLVRLRAGRQPVTNAETFRSQVLQALKEADQQAKNLGNAGADTRLAAFAFVAFLDESILNLRNPIFADWVRKPLQEHLFGRHTAGEIFFDELSELLARPDTPGNADLLEVYTLCLRLGFLGKYSVIGHGEARIWADKAEEKIRRIRQSNSALAPHTAPPPAPSLVIGQSRWHLYASAAGGFTLLLFALYSMLLRASIGGLAGL
ncbi:MAG: DotU family type IV/VI secretion system protein [Acidobacteria bacterium]|nr:DotU family type IV/VI secretion system protein [Acidobacteriota bacterium]